MLNPIQETATLDGAPGQGYLVILGDHRGFGEFEPEDAGRFGRLQQAPYERERPTAVWHGATWGVTGRRGVERWRVLVLGFSQEVVHVEPIARLPDNAEGTNPARA